MKIEFVVLYLIFRSMFDFLTVNRHNDQYWSQKNLNLFHEVHTQYLKRLNVQNVLLVIFDKNS